MATPTNVSPADGKVGDVVFYTVTPDETLAGAPALTIGGPSSPSFVYEAGTEYIFAYTVAGGEGDGTFTASLDMTDTVGNAVTYITDKT